MSGTCNSKERRKDAPHVFQCTARFGEATIGLIYLMLGLLALKASFGLRQNAPEPVTVLKELIAGPFGMACVGLIATGLIAHAIWKAVQAIKDTEEVGSSLWAILLRVGAFGSSVFSILLALCALQLLIGFPIGSGDKALKELTFELFSRPFGRVFLGLVGITTLVIAAIHFRIAFTGAFQGGLAVRRMDHSQKTWISTLAVTGIISKGIVLGIVGFFLCRAAWTENPFYTKGISGALEVIAHQKYGSWLLSLIGLGFAAYGGFLLSHLRFKRNQKL